MTSPPCAPGQGTVNKVTEWGSAAATGLAWAFFVLAGISVAAAIQELYARVFELRPRGANDMPRKLHSLASGGSRCGS